ncbi:hypothetical protein [Vibrio sp. D431a]|uniref:hypothetical protein n=1 Tax=Vibrio sp. D431a TaxID=2837388 RepID=UPI00255224EF|nr:hypothetical protein [Vibrio sp. D431a]MDK9793920.1 hypothetical protein [Vibrio sp. D431a]
MGIFKEISKDEFFLKKNSSQFQSLSNTIAARVGGVLRDIIDHNVTESNEQSINKIGTNTYLNEFSDKYNYKLGILIGEADFITVAFDNAFLKTCSYFWVGGTGKSEHENKVGKLTLIEETFLDQFYAKIKSKVDETLQEFGLTQASVNFIVDKAIALKKDSEILLNHISYNIDRDQARMVLMGTTNVIANMQNNLVQQSAEELTSFVRNEIKHDVIVEMCELEIPANTFLNMKAGDRFKIDYKGSAKLRISEQENHFCEGSILQGEGNTKLIKIGE